MGYFLEDGERLDAGIRRIAREEIAGAVASLRDEAKIHEGVHDARKRLKKVRAILRLVRDEVGEGFFKSENAFYRDRGRELAEVRDARVAVQCLDGLRSHFASTIDERAFRGIRDRLVERSDDTARRHLKEERRHEQAALALEASLQRIEAWPIGEDRFETIAPGIRRVYRRGRGRRDEAYEDPSFERFHEWRKRVKYLWYQVRILQQTWPRVMSRVADSLHRVAELVGDSTDLAELSNFVRETEALAPDRTERDALLALIEARRAEFQALARPLGLRIWHESPGQFVDRLGTFWEAWRRERRWAEARPDRPRVASDELPDPARVAAADALAVIGEAPTEAAPVAPSEATAGSVSDSQPKVAPNAAPKGALEVPSDAPSEGPPEAASGGMTQAPAAAHGEVRRRESVEIERKFLVLGTPQGTSVEIRQGYLSAGDPEVRVRLVDGNGVLTVKKGIEEAPGEPDADGSPPALERIEIDIALEPERAEWLFEHCRWRLVKKRYTVGRWEIDEIEGPDGTFLLAEVELQAPDEPLPALPSGLRIHREVTDNPAYLNQSIARRMSEVGATDADDGSEPG